MYVFTEKSDSMAKKTSGKKDAPKKKEERAQKKSFVSIQEAIQQYKGLVSLRGWVYRERGNAQIKFIVLRDATNIIQCVIKREDVGDTKFKEADKLQIEASLELEGELHKDERAPTGYEVRVATFSVVGPSEA